MSDAPWYADGLRFECTRCGHCCTGASGSVRVNDAEIDALAQRLDVVPEEFRAMYTHRLDGGANSLRERGNGDCVFFDRARGCTVYSDRPRQCRTWPFWSAVTETPQSWAKAAGDCPGMNRGALFSADEVLARSRKDGSSRSPI